MSHIVKSSVLCFAVLIGACGRAPDSKADLQEEANKALIRREFEEVWNQGKLEVMDEIYAADIVFHYPSSPDIHGAEGVKPIAKMFYTAFPDMQYTIEDMIAEGDKVAIRWTLTGTHKGELMGVSPIGVQVTFRGNTIVRLDGGRYVELWSSFDSRVIWLQLGVTPPPGQSEE